MHNFTLIGMYVFMFFTCISVLTEKNRFYFECSIGRDFEPYDDYSLDKRNEKMHDHKKYTVSFVFLMKELL